MAKIISFVNPEVRYNPFTGIPELERQKSGIPRAEVIFSKRDATWSGPGAGNNRQLLAAMNLDTSSNFGYVLMDCFAGFYDGTHMNMAATAAVDIFPGGDVFSGDRIPTQMQSEGDRSDSAASTAIGDIQYPRYNSAFADTTQSHCMIFRLVEPKPTGIIYPYEAPGASSLVNVTFGEEILNGADYKYDFYCRFLQYDVSQAYNYVPNTPQLTR